MALYKTKVCKVGYNPEITTSTDPEDVCTGLGLNGNGTYVFPTKVPTILEVRGEVFIPKIPFRHGKEL